MASVNKVVLIGNLGADPENRFMTNGDAVCSIRLATTESWKDKNSGEKKEITEWHRVVFYRKLAEIAAEYLKKGSSVYIEGRLRTRKWTDKDGAERYTTEIEASELQMLGKPPVSSDRNTQGADNRTKGTPAAGNQASTGGSDGNARKPAPAYAGPGDEDIPFLTDTMIDDPMLAPMRARRHA